MHSVILSFMGLGGAQVFSKVGAVSKGPGFKFCSLDGKWQLKNLVSTPLRKTIEEKTQLCCYDRLDKNSLYSVSTNSLVQGT